MGCVYDRNKSRPELGPNVYVRFKGPLGKWVSRPVGKVKPGGLTKAQLRRKTKELERLAGDVLSRIEGDIVAGRYELEDASRPRPEKELFKKVVNAWVDERQEANRLDPAVHRAWRDEKSRIKCHLIPFFGQMPIQAVTTAEVKEFIATKRGKLKRQTIINCLNVISRMYNDLREAQQDVQNPVALLDRATRRSIGKKQDPRETPYLKTKGEIRNLHLAFSGPIQVMFDIGVFGGLRPGEIRALRVSDVDLDRRRIQVQRSVKGPVKNNQSRQVPILDALLPLLRVWIAQHPGKGLLFPPTSGRGEFIREHTLHKHIRKALKDAKLPESLTWYQCTRHTFASHWVMDGRPIEKLGLILGHSSVSTTERYAHLSPDLFTAADLSAIEVDLREPRILELERTQRTGNA